MVKPLFKTALEMAKNHSAGATLVVSGAGYLCAIYTGCKATVNAVRKIDNEAEKRGEQLSKKEIVECSWRYYATTAALATCSTIGLVFAGKNYNSQIKNLATLYAFSEAAMRDQTEAIKEYAGKKKKISDEIHDISSKKAVDRGYSDAINVVNTGKGNDLCLDKFSGRYFRIDVQNLRKAINNANYLLNKRGYLSYNDLFYEIGDEFQDSGYGEIVGWNSETGLIEPRFTSALTKDDEPCLVLDFYNRPYMGYDK